MKNKGFRTIAALLLCGLLIGLAPVGVFADGSGEGVIPVQVAGGDNHTVVLYSDGTVRGIGRNSYGQTDVSGWSGITQIAAGFDHTVGVRADGTVVAVGSNSDGQCDVESWTDIIQVAAGQAHTLGLRADGTVVAVGRNNYHQCEVENWKDVTQISAAMVNSLGLTRDNQVIIRGAFTTEKNFHLGGWTNVVSVEAGTGYFAGVKANKTVVGSGINTDPEGKGQYTDISVDGWKNIVQVAVGRCNAFGLTEKGHVFCSGRNDFKQKQAVEEWNKIVYIGAGTNHVIGIRKNGTLVAAGDNSYGKCDVAQLNPAPVATTAPIATTAPAAGPMFLNELPCSAITGKLWSRSDPNGSVRDNRGNAYTYGLHVGGEGVAFFGASFDLGGRYETLTGICGYPEEIIDTRNTPNQPKFFQVYGDGALLYTSDTMDANTDPFFFKVDIKDVQILTISYPDTQGSNEAATLFDLVVR